MKVRAIRLGYYNHERKQPGSVFNIESEKHFSKKWMEPFEEGKKVEKPAPKSKAKSKDDDVI